MIVATAGHIDHGKTTLVRALTGVETDRLPEERSRGISIDLGFAYWPLGDDKVIGFIDVPGHERFVRNMLAGVNAIDFALIAIAADDGIMPQTIEHMQILDLLGASKGLVALTKVDRATPARIAEVRADIELLLSDTRLAGSPIFEVATPSGTGVPQVAEFLRAACLAHAARYREGRNFRMAIDRAFVVPGSGTVVTGTVLDGETAIGARLVLSGRGKEVRVRGLQSGGAVAQEIRAGQRCAVNLVGAELGDVHRGDLLLDEAIHSPTQRLDAELVLLDTAGQPLKHYSSGHLHIGTADVSVRILTPGQAAVAPGQRALIQLVPDKPICALTGDRFILRDQSARRTLGGGRILDPFAESSRRASAQRLAVLHALRQDDAESALAALLAVPDVEIDTRRQIQRFNLRPERAAEMLRKADAVVVGPGIAVPAARLASVSAALLDALGKFHREDPAAVGMTHRMLKTQAAPSASKEFFQAVLKELTDSGRVETRGPLVKLSGHVAAASPADMALWQRLLPLLNERGALTPTLKELADLVRVPEGNLKAFIYRRRTSGDLWRVTEDRFLPRAIVAQLAASAAALAAAASDHSFNAAQFRDAIAVGRTLAIQILEFFDSIGVTRRIGDTRKMQPDHEAIVGSAHPYVPSHAPPPPPVPGKSTGKSVRNASAPSSHRGGAGDPSRFSRPRTHRS